MILHCSHLDCLHVVQVYITIKGTKGKLPKRQLLQKSNGKRQGRFRFNKGTTHVFKFDGQDIRDITSVIIEVSILYNMCPNRAFPCCIREVVFCFNLSQFSKVTHLCHSYFVSNRISAESQRLSSLLWSCI